MNAGALFWLVTAGVAAVVFFGILLVVSVRGAVELLEMLRESDPHRKP